MMHRVVDEQEMSWDESKESENQMRGCKREKKNG